MGQNNKILSPAILFFTLFSFLHLCCQSHKISTRNSQRLTFGAGVDVAITNLFSRIRTSIGSCKVIYGGLKFVKNLFLLILSYFLDIKQESLSGRGPDQN